MTVDERDELEAATDPLVALAAHQQRLSSSSPVYDDPLLVGQLAKQARADRRAADRAGEMEQRAQAALHARILIGVQGARLGVRIADEAPALQTLTVPRAIGPELLAEAERQHLAIVVPELRIAAGAGREVWDGECDALVGVPSELPRGRYVAVKVAGDSMEPLLHSGDTILVRLGTTVEVGTVAVARDPEHGYMVKEVRSVDRDWVELASLNESYGTTRVPNVCGAVLGTVLMRWCVHNDPRPRPAA